MVLLTQDHPQVHAYANWSVNPESRNPFVRRISLITISYNHSGRSGFPSLLQLLVDLGLYKFSTYEAIDSLSTSRVPDNAPFHNHLMKIAHVSPYIAFIGRLRGFFLAEFEKYKTDFAGIDGEAFFISTVLHSTEHANAAYFVDDFALTWKNPRYRANFESASLSRTGLTTQLTLALPFNDPRFKYAEHPLFQRVYAYAKTLDARLADEMEAAIIR